MITSKMLADTIRHDVQEAHKNWLTTRRELAVMLAEHGTPYSWSLEVGSYDVDRDRNRETKLTALELAMTAEAEWTEWAEVVIQVTGKRYSPCRVPAFDLSKHSDEDIIAAARRTIDGCQITLNDPENNSSLMKAEWGRLQRAAARRVGNWLKNHIEQYDKRQAAAS